MSSSICRWSDLSRAFVTVSALGIFNMRFLIENHHKMNHHRGEKIIFITLIFEVGKIACSITLYIQ